MFGFLLLFGIVFFIIWLYKHRSSYWSRQGIDGPNATPFFGNLRGGLLRTDRNAVLQLYDWTKQYGKVYGIQEGWRNVLVVSDVDMLQDVFVKKFDCFHGRKLFPVSPNSERSDMTDLFHSQGSRWKRLRALSSPLFTDFNLKQMMPTVVHSGDVMIEYLKEKAEKKEFFNIHLHLQEFTLDVTSRIALGQKGSLQFKNKNFEIIRKFAKVIPNTPVHLLAMIAPFAEPILCKILAFILRTVRNVFKDIVDQLSEVLATRREPKAQGMREEMDEYGRRQVDFIDLFLDAESEERLDDVDSGKSGMKAVKRLSTAEIKSQCLLFFLAGSDTSANTLGFALYCLAKDLQSQERIRAEIDEVIGGGEIVYEDLKKLNFLDNVVKEAMRLYPVGAGATARQCMQTTTIGSSITIERGTYVQADVFAVHRDKSLWGEDAEEFRPDRWNAKTSHPAAWLGFGLGPRMCVGTRLANMVVRVALVKIFTNFEIVASASIDDDFGLFGGSGLMPAAVLVQLKLRN